MNILVNAYAVAPNWGSEQGVGWNWVVRLAKKCQVFVITEGEWRKEIEEEVLKLPWRDNLHFYYNPVSQKVRDMCWNQGDWRFYYFYRKWQRRTEKIAREIIADHHIDLIHQLNRIGFREPGYLWKIEDIPFVWGPVGNMEPMNMEFAKGLSMAEKLKLRLKNKITYFQARNGRVAKAAKRADTIYSVLEGTATIVRKVYGKQRVFVLLEAGIENTALVKHDYSDCKRPLQILWVGRFIPTKKLDLALEVISGLASREFEFHVVGWGSKEEEAAYRRMADRLGVAKQLVWHGKIPHEEVQHLMSKSDILLFTSVVEGTPNVVLEAVSNNLPVVCFDICGQGVIVNEKIGIKVKTENIEQMRQEMTDVLNDLFKNRDKLATMSQACEQRKPELTWENKIDRVIEGYLEAIERNSHRS